MSSIVTWIIPQQRLKKERGGGGGTRCKTERSYALTWWMDRYLCLFLERYWMMMSSEMKGRLTCPSQIAHATCLKKCRSRLSFRFCLCLRVVAVVAFLVLSLVLSWLQTYLLLSSLLLHAPRLLLNFAPIPTHLQCIYNILLLQDWMVIVECQRYIVDPHPKNERQIDRSYPSTTRLRATKGALECRVNFNYVAESPLSLSLPPPACSLLILIRIHNVLIQCEHYAYYITIQRLCWKANTPVRVRGGARVRRHRLAQRQARQAKGKSKREDGYVYMYV